MKKWKASVKRVFCHHLLKNMEKTISFTKIDLIFFEKSRKENANIGSVLAVQWFFKQRALLAHHVKCYSVLIFHSGP